MLPPKLRRLLPRPFRRGEGWGEGLLGVVYPAVLAVLFLALSAAAGPIRIQQVEPTPFFPKPAVAEPLRQQARLCLENSGPPLAIQVSIQVGDARAYLEDLGEVPAGCSTNVIAISDIAAPTRVVLQVLEKNSGSALARRELEWQPQKKWSLYCTSYSHQDLGFGDYPHRIRTTIRHANIRLPLQFCRETDDWPEESKYRFNIETSEPITSFVSFFGQEQALELGRRIREGRIQLLGLHNTANTEQLSPELMARLFYLACRHTPDLLGVPPSRTGQNDDVIGLTWPLATYAREAGITRFFHGFNRLCMPNVESGRYVDGFQEIDGEQGRHIFSIANEPVFYWQGPDGQTVLRRATTYERHSILWDPYERNPADVQDAQRLEFLIRAHEKIGWPFSAMLSQDGGDFMLVKRTIANRARAWNLQYAYPRLISATFDMFFNTVEQEIQRGVFQPKSIASDENNQWSDQDYNDAWLGGRARRLGESLPVTEKLATLAQVLGGTAYPWTDIYQAYHRLLQYHEHTNAKDGPGSTAESLRQYETELEENREMVDEAQALEQKVRAAAVESLSRFIVRSGSSNLVVFNSLSQTRTDVVRCPPGMIPEGMQLVDASAAARVPLQRLADGTCLFIGAEVPALGYRSYRLEPADSTNSEVPLQAEAADRIENPFYRVEIEHRTGTLKRLFDKKSGVELVDSQAPYRFNQYLYCRTFQRDGKWETAWEGGESPDTVSLQHGSVADVITVVGKAKGVAAYRQTILLYKELPRIDFSIWLDKLPFAEKYGSNREGVFVALPFAVPDFVIHHELPGAVLDPYRQLAAGSATDHFAIRSFTDLSNDKFGVTVSPVEGSLVCYGEPQVAPQPPWYEFNRSQEYPKHSRLYLYLLNNMFGTNVRIDQRGPVSFSWSMRGHGGDWRTGAAASFGQGVLQPLVAWRADGRGQGPCPAQGSFLGLNVSNVECRVIKPAEANGRGVILRFNETTGRETVAQVTLPFLPAIQAVVETSLTEEDRPIRPSVTGSNSFAITLRPFGVKTLRITSGEPPGSVSGLKVEALADRQTHLSWSCDHPQLSHFDVFRDTRPDCAPILLNRVGQSPTTSFTDLPQLNAGGWIRSALEPATTYYYRVVPVDRWNNPGNPGGVVPTATLTTAQSNLPPMAVEGLRAVPVSPLARFNFVNLLFRTACESDIAGYEIHRSTERGFAPTGATLIGRVNSTDAIPGSATYGHTVIDYAVKDFDHAMFADTNVTADTTYFYQVRAVDNAGQAGPASVVAMARTKALLPASPLKVSASSVYAPEYGPEAAVDGDPDPLTAWVAKPFGGGTREAPADTWWVVEFPRRIALSGVTVVGDARPEIPIQRRLRVEYREGSHWRVAAEVQDATEKTLRCRWPSPLQTDALRLFVPAADLPKSTRPEIPDGVVRVCEVLLLLPNGREVAPEQALSP